MSEQFWPGVGLGFLLGFLACALWGVSIVMRLFGISWRALLDVALAPLLFLWRLRWR